MTVIIGPIKILIVGKDARTHAIVEALRRSGVAIELAIYSEFRIPGLVRNATRFKQGKLTFEDLDEIVKFAKEFEPDFAIIGPEEPLEFGLVDHLLKLGIPCFGPTKSLAQIETSKSWTRHLMEKHHVAGCVISRSFDSMDGLVGFAQELGDIVVKPDGLTGGKGVKVMGDHLDTVDDAIAYAKELIQGGDTVVIEERLEGEEFSLQSITDGVTVVHCPPVQDHKRAGRGDTGPNTGGMGSYSDADGMLPFLDPSDLEEAQRINETVVRILKEETGEPYRGVLYGGFMVTRDGVRVIEYNARFGDPEAMNVLAIFEGNFVELAQAVATGTLDQVSVSFAKKATVCKYVVPDGYPDSVVHNEIISVDEDDFDPSKVHCYWAATNLNDEDKVELTRSRAVAFVGIADTLEEAEALAEGAARSVGGPVRWRSDIGTADLIQQRVDHMQELRQP